MDWGNGGRFARIIMKRRKEYGAWGMTEQDASLNRWDYAIGTKDSGHKRSKIDKTSEH